MSIPSTLETHNYWKLKKGHENKYVGKKKQKIKEASVSACAEIVISLLVLEKLYLFILNSIIYVFTTIVKVW